MTTRSVTENFSNDSAKEKTKYGIQMYSLRDITQSDLRGALRAVAEMGYKYVEFAGFFGNSAADVRSWLDELGLTVVGTHTALPALARDTIEETIAYHKAIGCDTIIVPCADWDTEEQMNDSIDAICRASKRLAEDGMSLGYHNHSAEFCRTPYGRIIEEEIIARTDAFLEIDTFWLFNAGIDPVSYLETHKDRIKLIHLKDGYHRRCRAIDYGTSFADVTGTSVGMGEAPVLAVRDWANANGVKMVVESEGLDPTGLDEVRRCIDFLGAQE